MELEAQVINKSKHLEAKIRRRVRQADTFRWETFETGCKIIAQLAAFRSEIRSVSLSDLAPSGPFFDSRSGPTVRTYTVGGQAEPVSRTDSRSTPFDGFAKQVPGWYWYSLGV